MKGMLTALIFSSLIVLSSVVPLMAQGVNVGYTIHIDFYSLSCSLDNVQVSLYDRAGHQVGEASSPSGGEVAISFRASAPISTLSAVAFGHASIGSYYSRSVSGSRMINVGTGGDYWISVPMY